MDGAIHGAVECKSGPWDRQQKGNGFTGSLYRDDGLGMGEKKLPKGRVCMYVVQAGRVEGLSTYTSSSVP